MGIEVIVGVYAIMVYDERVFLFEVLIHHLHLIGKAILNIVNKSKATTLWIHGWMSIEEIIMVGDMTIEWKNYICTI
jgi:hypothetical protein